MSEEEFLDLPVWKQKKIKKEVGLFWLLAWSHLR